MPSPDWSALRSQFPVFRDWAYLGWASVASLPRPVADAMRYQINGVETDGVTRFPQWYADATKARTESARLLNAQPDEIALLKNTGEGLSTIAYGLDIQAGENVVVPHGEFPANAYPWLGLREKGIEIRRVPTDEFGRYSVNDIKALVDVKTRVLSVSWVNFSTGFRVDLQGLSALCRHRNIFFCLDAIQGLGVVPMDVQKCSIDAIAADGHKWICGPEGQALFYLRKDRLEEIRPLARGWASVVQPGLFERDDQALSPNARRFECGTLPGVTVAGFAAALELINTTTPAHIQERIFSLTSSLCRELARIGLKPHVPLEVFDPSKPDLVEGLRTWSGIITFDLPGKDVKVVAKSLEQKKILINPRNGRLRVSLHAWNSEQDIERLIAAL